MAEIPAVQRFITEDEIAATLTRGSNIEGDKGRIYAYFKEKHTPKEQADFLKKGIRHWRQLPCGIRCIPQR